MKPARLLVIAGSDSNAGAGLQADLKTAQAFGVYAQTAVTAVTAQDTQSVRAVEMMPPELVYEQILAALGDIGADAIKIGMLGNGAIVAAVAEALKDVSLPLVLDTVLLSSSGTPLLDDLGVEMLRRFLLPRATLITPNIPEAEALTNIRPRSDHSRRNCAQAFGLMGARQILFKGGHAAGDMVRDVLMIGDQETVFEAPRQVTPHTHGTGCTLSTAIACGLAQGLPLAEAVARGHAFVQDAIKTAPQLGQGHGPLGHAHRGQG
jgi:hydroxymethylpyrimidine/phosphomethylpyrimidine kinase